MTLSFFYERFYFGKEKGWVQAMGHSLWPIVGILQSARLSVGFTYRCPTLEKDRFLSSYLKSSSCSKEINILTRLETFAV